MMAEEKKLTPLLGMTIHKTHLHRPAEMSTVVAGSAG